MIDQHQKAYLYIAVAALFLVINGYIKGNPIIPLWSEPLLNAITQIVTIGSFIIGLVNYIANFGHEWTKDNVVKPVSRSVNFITLACSDKDISEIKSKIKALKEEMDSDKSFWEEFFG